MLEKQLEDYLVTRVLAAGGITAKLTVRSGRGWPDRLVLLPGGVMALVEVKRPGSKAVVSEAQKFMFSRFKKLETMARIVRSKADVDEFMRDTGMGKDARELETAMRLMELTRQG